MTMILRLCLLVWPLLVAGIVCSPYHEQLSLQPGSRSQPYLDESFDNDVKKTLEYWKVPGLSIAVVDGDDVYSKVLNTSWFTSCI